ncbi:FHA domain-containing protein [Micromonospora sp. DR5-3]|uniref:FHA domain-containing protein n=1 Tax=unclassified Micromonospora TaxID=2617518 RepID=UPI0011DA6C5C|nr:MULTISPECIES: FHA domain-containing protein [unclassified Micromonospora]MCW3814442.1 FHA domain-containing protein [Micromonospora sp. DR5-3]TYC22666.1 FHA domain-containing protein [Micromonospora sp. MP36]
MAELICRWCHRPVSPGDLICLGCQANLVDAVVDGADLAADAASAMSSGLVSAAEFGPPPGADNRPGAGGADGPGTGLEAAATCPSCDGVLPAADPPVCPACLTPLAGALVLELDAATPHGRWRRVVLPGTELVLGRDPRHSPAAAVLGRYDTVSRRHARVAVDQDRRARVTDLDSLNGTFVDDVPVPPGTTVDLRPGSLLRLGRTVSLRVGPA